MGMFVLQSTLCVTLMTLACHAASETKKPDAPFRIRSMGNHDIFECYGWGHPDIREIYEMKSLQRNHFTVIKDNATGKIVYRYYDANGPRPCSDPFCANLPECATCGRAEFTICMKEARRRLDRNLLIDSSVKLMFPKKYLRFVTVDGWNAKGELVGFHFVPMDQVSWEKNDKECLGTIDWFVPTKQA